MTDSATVCVKLVTPLDGTIEFLTHLGTCSVTLEFICEVRPVWKSTFVEAQTCLHEGVTRFLKRCSLRCTIDHEDWFRKSQMD